MCQLNLYIVPKTVKKEVVLDILKNCFCYQNPECVNHENILKEVQDLNNVYVSAAMGCNCGTVQTHFQEVGDDESWLDVKKRMVFEKIEKLKQIKILLDRPDYLDYKNRVLERASELEKNFKDASGEIYQTLLKEWQKFFNENSLLYEAMMRYEKHKTENGKDVVYHCIEEEIENVEKNEFSSIENEFEDLLKFIDAILEECGEIKLLSFWQDGNNPFVKNEKFVMRKELKIDDVVFLKDNELLTILAD